jgi:hypothetical protein
MKNKEDLSNEEKHRGCGGRFPGHGINLWENIAAAAGGTGAAILSASGQQHLKIPAETRLEFTLQANLKVQ